MSETVYNKPPREWDEDYALAARSGVLEYELVKGMPWLSEQVANRVQAILDINTLLMKRIDQQKAKKSLAELLYEVIDDAAVQRVHVELWDFVTFPGEERKAQYKTTMFLVGGAEGEEVYTSDIQDSISGCLQQNAETLVAIEEEERAAREDEEE